MFRFRSSILASTLIVSSCTCGDEPIRYADDAGQDATPDAHSSDSGGGQDATPDAHSSDSGVLFADTVHTTEVAWQTTSLDPTTVDHATAEAYCDTLVLDGHDDWRLPSRAELSAIVDYTASEPALDALAFPDSEDTEFWSSTRYIGAPEEDPWFWGLFTDSGAVDAQPVSYPKAARCVRSTGAHDDDRIVHSDGTVSDARTGLRWQRFVDDTTYDQAEAAAHCASLPLGGFDSGWRLPTVAELGTLVDDAELDPAIDETVFPGIPPTDSSDAFFWTSTPFAGDPQFAWYQGFDSGSTGYTTTSFEAFVRCVR